MPRQARYARQGGRMQRPGRNAGLRGRGTQECTCPKCDHTETHERGVPCNTKVCPKCEAKMQGSFCSQ